MDSQHGIDSAGGAAVEERAAAPVDDSALGADAVDRIVEDGLVTAVFQPIVNLRDGSVFGYEALARVNRQPALPPDRWLALAEANGKRRELEHACLRAAAAAGDPPRGSALFVNVSPDVLADPRTLGLRAILPDRLVVELTERDVVDDYDALRAHIARWRERGVRVAIDDTGSGWSTLRHVVQLQPDFIKLDRSLIADVGRDRSRRALVHAMVAFAQESGAVVVAEGVERHGEVDALIDAGVHLVQGWLLARPGPPWVTPLDPRPDRPRDIPGDRHHYRHRQRLAQQLERAADPREACSVVADHLARLGGVMPSVYLERGGVLRCQAQRGLWQVLDGMPLGVGITGRTYATGTAMLIPDVRGHPDYLEAIPGVVSELCVPIRAHGVVVGSLNVEMCTELAGSVVSETEHCAAALGRRLETIGTGSGESPQQRLVRHAARIAELTDVPQLEQAVLDAAIDVSGMDSAALAVSGTQGLAVVRAAGPLAPVLSRLSSGDLVDLSTLVSEVASCYTAGDSTGRGFVGTDTLRAAGARTVAVVPLLARGRRTGILLVADTVAASLQTGDAQLLELLGAQAGTCLDNAAMVAELRERARRDPLTGLGNHSAFHEALDQARRERRPWHVVLADIDRFKAVNDERGHLTGDDTLRSVARALRGAVRGDDLLFRIGGDEFAALLPDMDTAAARRVAERLVRVAATTLDAVGASLSVGVAALVPGEPTTEALRRADRSLYQAKRSGRGTVCMGNEPAAATEQVIAGRAAKMR